MQIKKVEIENFRVHQQAKVHFQKLHALVGENGSGKTAILEAINLAATPSPIQFRVSEQDFNNRDLGDIKIEVEFDKYFILKLPDGFTTQKIPCNKTRLRVSRRLAASSGKALSEPFVVSKICVPCLYSSKEELNSNLLPRDISLEDLPPSVKKVSQGYQVRRKSGNIKNVSATLLSISKNLIGFPNIFYFGRTREKEMKTGLNTLLSKIAKDLNWRYRKAWNADTARDSWDAYYNEVINTVEEDKRLRILQPARERLVRLLGESFQNLEFSLLNIEQPFSRTFLSIRDGLNQIDVSGLGSGVALILAYTLLETISNLSKEELVFLVDEPELHLHPQIQRRLFTHFEQSQIQFIYTTHSPYFVNLGHWRSISRFDENADILPKEQVLTKQLDGQKIEDHLSEIPQWYQHRTIFSEADSELLFGRRILLVEGPAEKYGLPLLAELFSIELKDVTIVSCNGKNKIPYYVLLCHAFGLNAFVLFDLDDEGIDCDENAKIIRAIDSFTFHAFLSSFEKLLGITGEYHKASRVLKSLDEIGTKEDVPTEIQEALEEIKQWCFQQT